MFYCRPEDLDAEAEARCQALLDDRERARRERFAFEKDRRLYLCAHALVRSVLSRHAPVDPRDWRFVENRHGCPEIAGPASGTPLRFNLSHTEGLAACAVTVGREVGVDVEHETRRPAPLAVAHRYFSPQEVEELRALPAEAQDERFFVYWTLKEAYIKARGLGLALPLDRFTFHLGPGAITISFVPPIDDDPDRWHFAHFRPTPHHRLALAVQKGDREPEVAITHAVPPDLK